MASRRSWWHATGFRLYGALYLAGLAFAFLHDLDHGRLGPAPIEGRVPGVVGLVVVGLVTGLAVAGRTAVALHPTPADVQHALLSPAHRGRSLARAMRMPLVLVAVLAAFVMAALMVTSTAQFSGLSFGSGLAYLLAAAGVGVIGFGAHVLVAEGRGKPMVWAGVAVAMTLVADIAKESASSPVTATVRSLRGNAAVVGVAAVYAVGAVLVWMGARGAERIELEAIVRGVSTADRASVALAGNDVRTLLVLYRSLAPAAWRQRAAFRVPQAVSLRTPVLARSLRGIARWRPARWVFVSATAIAVAGLVRVHPASLRSTALAALVLWALGLAVNEPLAQEHDRADRLALLPNARSVEYRHIGVGWVCAFLPLSASIVVALMGEASFASALGLAAGAASGATVAAAVTLRATWKPLLNPHLAGQPPEAIATQILFNATRPGLLAFACVSLWRVGLSGVVLAAPGAFAMVILLAWIATDGFSLIRRTALGRVPA